MEFCVLGPVEVYDGERQLPIGAAKQRTLLAILLIHANEAVSAERLIDDLWGEKPPDGAGNTLQVYVSQLRKVLEQARAPGLPPQNLVTRGPGYMLRVREGELDLQRFEQLADEGRAALREGGAGVASEKLARALALWRGRAFADVAFEDFAREAVTRAEELRTVVLEDRVEADLSLGKEAELVPELRGLVAAHPLRERLWGQLMLALYRAGRQAEALQTYQQARRVLGEELGIDPGSDLQELEQAIDESPKDVALLEHLRLLAHLLGDHRLHRAHQPQLLVEMGIGRDEGPAPPVAGVPRLRRWRRTFCAATGTRTLRPRRVADSL